MSRKLGKKTQSLLSFKKCINKIKTIYNIDNFLFQTDNISGFHTKSILCKPIRNRSAQTIGKKKTGVKGVAKGKHMVRKIMLNIFEGKFRISKRTQVCRIITI